LDIACCCDGNLGDFFSLEGEDCVSSSFSSSVVNSISPVLSSSVDSVLGISFSIESILISSNF